MNGTSHTTFNPDMTLTRAQFVTILHNVEGGDSLLPDEYSDKFVDVPNGQWYTDSVIWVWKNKITSGISENKFGTNAEITREQLATLLYQYATVKGDKFVTTKNGTGFFVRLRSAH